jgi:hypothetical protein
LLECKERIKLREQKKASKGHSHSREHKESYKLGYERKHVSVQARCTHILESTNEEIS